MQTHATAGVDAYETPWRGHIKGATKAKSECMRFPLTLMRTHKRSPSLTPHLPPSIIYGFQIGYDDVIFCAKVKVYGRAGQL